MVDDSSVTDWQAPNCLTRARQWEPHIRAWVGLLDEQSLSGGHVGAVKAAFEGVGFAVKDIIDVAGHPTQFGSRAFAHVPPALGSAPVVAALNDAGAVCIGKTTSTEFAFIDPTESRNPNDLRCTPGGSSSGSGAVVGARVVPFALGTQTAGSLCRPAAYCGAYSYKASLGWWPMQGIAPFARSFDMVGPIAVSMSWLLSIHDVWARSFDRPLLETGREFSERPLVIGVLSTPDQSPSASVAAAISDAAERFAAAGHKIEPFTPPVSFAEIIAAHRQVMLAEAAADVLPMLGAKRSMLGPKLAEALQQGEMITPDEVGTQRLKLVQAAQSFWSAAHGIDLMLAPPVGAVAPIGLTTTGDQTYLTPWTALGGPLVSMPHGKDDAGMPLSIMLAGKPGNDASLLTAASRLDLLLEGISPPPLPASA